MRRKANPIGVIHERVELGDGHHTAFDIFVYQDRTWQAFPAYNYGLLSEKKKAYYRLVMREKGYEFRHEIQPKPKGIFLRHVLKDDGTYLRVEKRRRA